ncbi:tetratricopeptide repeat protein [Agaribacterium haliotis]|uniref:tetratricopeptide repeat protein n=1 Tax=Agaribacterium haliotis TaxID=2013869 RepID=UPI000BB53276|nr:tetratricopeptide repeat protein [Agaribacterium haliotis]
MRSQLRTPGALLLFLAINTTVFAETYFDINAVYKQAQQAFNAKQYQQALDLYQSIETTELNNSTLFNIAICHYKLGQWQKAYRAFSELNKQEQNDELVQLNLALTQYKLGEQQQALAQLDWLYQTAESDNISMLAYQHLKKLDQAKNKHWFVSASVGTGIDDNVISVVDAVASSQSDTFTELSLNPSWFSSEDFDNNWVLDASYYNNRYREVSDYDIRIVAAGIRKNFSLIKANRSFVAARLDQSEVGDDDYMQSTFFDLGNRYKNSSGLRLDYGLRWQKMQELSSLYKPFAGNSNRFYGKLTQTLGAHHFALQAQFDNDNRNDSGNKQLGQDFISYSALRWGIKADWRYKYKRWSSKLFYQWRTSEYKDANVYWQENRRLPERIVREDTRAVFGLQISLDLPHNYYADLEWRNTNNDSNIDDYSYKQQLINASLGFQF